MKINMAFESLIKKLISGPTLKVKYKCDCGLEQMGPESKEINCICGRIMARLVILPVPLKEI